VITALGYKVDHQVGSAGFLIDLGVCHPERPGTYILAVECDGSTYHSALWARERDRLRQSVLEHLGWRFHRVWSTDWFYRRAAEVDRLKAALEAAVKASDAGIVIEGGNDAAPRVSSTPTTIETIFDVPEAPERKMPSYARSQVSVRSHVDPHEADPNLLARLAAQIVEDEGPIHEEEVARRIAAAFGKERAGARILATVQRALKTAYRRSDISLRHEDAFWATSAQLAAPVVRDRSAETGPLCKAAFISMSEITEAVRLAMEDNAGGSDQEITRAASRLFGFKRVGSELQERLQAGLERLKEPDSRSCPITG
jgi:very-short-patch-repair endonuclease